MSIAKAVRIREKAGDLGFEAVGIAAAHPPPDFDFFRWWLDQGFAGTMAYLQRGMEKKGDPEKILPGVRSVICCGMNYNAAPPQGPVSNHARGDDYHQVVGERLRALEKFIGEIEPRAKTKSYVDTGPLLERSYAARAGLGWIGKNTCLINNGLGSFLFLGEILTTLEFPLEDYGRPGLDQCGSCTKCLEACPTGALVEPYVLDSRKCISYLTIEYRDEFTEEQSQMVGNHLYGCDICQAVCPYNERIPASPLQGFQPRLSPEKLEQASEKEFARLTKESAISRIHYKQWVRNLQAARRSDRR